MSNLNERGITRTDFLKSIGVAGVMLGGAAVLGGCSSGGSSEAAAKESAIMWDHEADVVVCGVGTGGAPAAIEASDAGCSVLMIEKKDWLGGSMRRCGGGIMGVNTKIQNKLGVTDDTPDMLFEYLVACGEGLIEEDLIRVLADNCGPNVDWIIAPISEGGLGGEPLAEWEFATSADKGEEMCIRPGLNVSGTPIYFDKFDMPENKRQRCHWFKPNPDDLDPGDRYYSSYNIPLQNNEGTWEGRGGTGLWKPFEEALKSRNIDIKTKASLVELITSKEGEAIGIVAEIEGKTVNIKANKGVVLATGAFARNPDMLLNYQSVADYKEPTEAQMKQVMPAPEECDGSSLLAAFAVGAGAKAISSAYGGLKINTSAQVLDVYGEVIPRLYASSRAVGGIYANLYPNCGASVAAWVCFGRIAGQEVAKLDAWK